MNKQKADALFSLIKRMTKQEKIHFKRHMKFWGGKNQQPLQLFDVMDSLKTFDEKLLKQNSLNCHSTSGSTGCVMI